MKCPKCDSTQKEGSKFCENCGLDFYKYIQEMNEKKEQEEKAKRDRQYSIKIISYIISIIIIIICGYIIFVLSIN